jgi:Protein of unknown function (DUF4125)/XdhC Rossmann domain
MLVTRGHKHDEIALRQVVNSGAAYIGMIGSRTRVRTVQERLMGDGFAKEVDTIKMATKADLISEVVAAEWRMHQAVRNVGGRAACQEDFRTFEINRSSQVLGWSEACLENYLLDLQLAEADGRNLQSEKYARMMKSTSPAEYATIQHFLPATDPATLPIIDEIVKIVIGWAEELAQKYPYLAARGRPLHSFEDSRFVTSVETYLRSELAVYSLSTLRLYRDNVLEQKANNVNGNEITLGQTMKRYGFKSLEEANERMRERA